MYNPFRYRAFFVHFMNHFKALCWHLVITALFALIAVSIHYSEALWLEHMSQSVFVFGEAVLFTLLGLFFLLLILFDLGHLFLSYLRDNHRLRQYPRAIKVPDITSPEFELQLQTLQERKEFLQLRIVQYEHLADKARHELQSTLLRESVKYRTQLLAKSRKKHH